jgi:hypothetical protein
MSDLSITEFEIAVANSGAVAIKLDFPVAIRTVPKRPSISVQNNQLVICRRKNERLILEGVLSEHLLAVLAQDVVVIIEVASEGSTQEVEYKATVIE